MADGPRSLLVPLMVVALLAAARGQELPPLPDPYTKGDAQAWAEAGYAPPRPLPFGDDHGSSAIGELLGEVPLLWVETEHFLIGSTLEEIEVEREARSQVKEELKRLGRRLPRVKKGARRLDPWLRLHLYAQRLEDLYARFEELAGVGAEDFPAPDPEAPAPVVSGGGAHLGMRGKFRVLLLQQQSSLGRWCQRYGFGDGSSPVRPYLPRRDALVFATAAEFLEGGWANDQALATHVVWSVTQNLIQGLEGYRFLKPRWLADGLAHHLARQVDERYPNFSALKGSKVTAIQEPDWPPRIRGRVQHGIFPDADELLGWEHGVPLKATTQMTSLARVEHLLESDPEAFARFLRGVAQPIDAGNRVPDHGLVRAQTERVLVETFSLDTSTWDAAFQAWVLDSYPRK